MTKSARRIGVLVVDDSAIVRRTLTDLLVSEKDIEVVGVAADPFIAAGKMREHAPDVIVLDIEMPRMDGLTFLRKVMSQHPIPVVICSALAEERAEATLRALEYGAVEIIQKPQVGTQRFLEESKVRIGDAIRAASKARVGRLQRRRRLEVEPKLTADAVLGPASQHLVRKTTDKVIAIGASTGGTEAIRALLEEMPPDVPGLVIVQHMPPHFTSAFAARLDGLCDIEVREAAHGDAVVPGRALIAPGDRHMLLQRTGAHYRVQVVDGPLVCRHRPSVDVLFRSVAEAAGQNAVGVIMTGMGDDGAAGMLEMRRGGARTIAQDEATSVVFGMPAEAIKRGAAEKVLPLEGIGSAVLRLAV